MSVKAVAPRQSVRPWPLHLPKQNDDLRRMGTEAGVSKIFLIWDQLIKTELAEEDTDGEPIFSLFTIDDESFSKLISKEKLVECGCDPFLSEPVLERLVLATQLVSSHIDLAEPTSSHLRTVGGRTLTLSTSKDGIDNVNGVKVKRTISAGMCNIFILEKALFIRPEDIEVSVEKTKVENSRSKQN